MSKIALLWHMHQPLYQGADGIFTMPWTFLHAIKDYYDMPWLLSRSGAKATFNITPTLMIQLQSYIDKGPNIDRFLSLWLKEPQSLSSSERSFVIKICKSAQFETMVKPLPGFIKLYEKNEYNDQELLNLEIFFMLSWCGNYLRQKSEIKELLAKASFIQKDKEKLLEILFSFLPTILPFYKKLLEKKQISLSTTPYAHPILPLLLDMENAKRANPATPLPKNPLSLEDDALLHIQKAKELYKYHFGLEPKGFWPAEGAVDEKSIALYEKNGIEWIATDEAILKKSGFGNPYKTYSYKNVKIFFRDHSLSDKIGFAYRYLSAYDAVSDFLNNLPDGKITFIILDGENPWEYYPNNGKEFLELFYEKIASKTVTFDEAAVEKAVPMKHIAPGSWIYGDFNTWVGDEEKNRAWELLYQTKRDALHHTVTPQIQEHFLLAECSDWFWWYGKGHYTQFHKEFDTLFRSHLQKIYQLLNLPIPKDLSTPIVGTHTLKAYISEPKEYITPIIDGRISSFFEWLGAGVIDESIAAVMDGANQPIKRLFWGEDGQNFYFRLDGDTNVDLKIFFDEKEISFFAKKGEIIEIKAPKPKKETDVRIEIFKDGKIVQILPSLTRLVIKPDSEDKNWFV